MFRLSIFRNEVYVGKRFSSNVDRISFSAGSAGNFFTATQSGAEFPENLKCHLRFLIDRLFEFVGMKNQELCFLLCYRRG
jgi:hypothetical protein